MRPRLPLVPLLLSCAVVLAGPVRAAEWSSGLSHAAAGQAMVDPSPDGRRLPVHNLGSSGQDGVDIDLSQLDGHVLHLDQPFSGSDAGTQLRYSYQWKLVSQPAGSGLCDVSLSVTPGGMESSFDLSSVGSSSQTLQVLSNGQVVSQFVVSNGTPVEMLYSSVSSGGSAPLPSCTTAISHGSSCQLQCTSSFTCDIDCGTLVTFSVAGQQVSGDAVRCIADLDRDGKLDVCAMRCACPSSSSLSSLTLDNEGVVRFSRKLFVTGLGRWSGQVSSLDLDNLGSSGQDGFTVDLSKPAGSSSSLSSGSDPSPALDCRFSPPVTFDPVTDDGASLTCRVLSTSSCGSNAPTIASLSSRMTGGHMELDYDFSGMCADAESAFVFSAGQRGPRQSVSLDGHIIVTAPPNEPLGMAINEKGLPGEKGTKKGTKAQQTAIAPAGGPSPSVSSQVGADGLQLHVGFTSPRVFDFGNGQTATGDDIVLLGKSSGSGGGGGGSVITIVGENFSLQRSSNPAGTRSLHIADLHSSADDQIDFDLPPSACLSSAHSSLTVPVTFTRADATPVRAFSVTLQLSPELQLAPGGITEGDYLSRSGPTQMFVTDNGGGSYTVDCAVLGGSGTCGPTDSGTLFSVAITPVVPSGATTGKIEVTTCQARDCSNAPVPAIPGGASGIPLDFSVLPKITSFTPSSARTGNPAGDRTPIAIQFTLSDPTSDAVEVYRAPFGNYPEYDDVSGAGAPAPPASYPPGPPWVLTSVSKPGDLDLPPTRDFFYYVAFEKDACGAVSPASDVSHGTLDYHLGDVADGSASTCSGDNRVSTADVSALGAHYGQAVGSGSPYACLDFAPTTDFSVDARPVTDDKINFEELVVLAINYGQVSAPRAGPGLAGTTRAGMRAGRPVAAAVNAVRVASPAAVAAGSTIDVALDFDGAGDAQAVSAKLGWDPAVVEPIAVAPGALLDQQDRGATVLSSEPGDVDVALLGTGTGITGSGQLAHVTFQVKAAGDPQVSVASLIARDAGNHPVMISGTAGMGEPAPARTALGLALPNPFTSTTTLRMSLRATGPATLAVYDVAGRRVRTLLDGVQRAGARTVTWDGRDEAGARLGAGVYLVRLNAGERVETRRIELVK
ncbi:MAG TPA: FlgD immunoglobulin-like domain containing protein [Candidatus Eisenbacteria bacterium]|nr:FlgD immunoglobulin-like domain containing protein [Candidatus Eisenbacteria bacterium]